MKKEQQISVIKQIEEEVDSEAKVRKLYQDTAVLKSKLVRNLFRKQEKKYKERA